MADLREKIALLKALLPPIEKTLELRKESANSLCGPCPKCKGNDRLVYRTDTRSFWCRQCGAKGDLIDFHAWVKNTDIKGLIKKYLPEESSDLDGYWEDLLAKYTNKTPIIYYLVGERNIYEAIVEQEIKRRNLTFCNYNGETCVAGCFRGLDGTIKTIEYISVYGKPLNQGGATKLFKAGTKASEGFFHAGVPIESAKLIVLNESIVNALSVLCAKPEACSLATGGSELIKKIVDLRPYRDKGARIVEYMDCDAAGDKARQQIIGLLGVKIFNVVWPKDTPNKTDSNDLLKAGKVDIIKQMIETAEPAKRIKKENDTSTKPLNDFKLTDLGNAERLVKMHGKSIKYCFPMKKYFVYDSQRWNSDNTGELRRMAKSVVKDLYRKAAELPDDAEVLRKAIVKFSIQCENLKRLKDMVELAQSEDGIPVLPDDFDKDPFLINCLNGTVNLKTGDLRPHNRDDFITKLAPVNYNPDAECPAWLRHLDKIMDNNEELVRFLQRAYGYSMTGDTSERKIFIQYGSGANGKSLTNDTIALVMGDYAMRTPTETLLNKRNEGIPNDVARLKGARFVYASEAEQGKRFAESLIKDLTGGDKVCARFLHCEYFEFYPEFKLFLGTNHKPEVWGTDHAIWDRIMLIPFTVRIQKDEQIPKTEIIKIFKDEIDGIFTWLVKGCLSWQREGLGCPDAVRDATTNYKNEMDVIGDFMDDSCVFGDNFTVSAKDLYDAYKEWAENNGCDSISKKIFGQKLNERGIDSYRGTANRVMRIGLKLADR